MTEPRFFKEPERKFVAEEGSAEATFWYGLTKDGSALLALHGLVDEFVLGCQGSWTDLSPPVSLRTEVNKALRERLAFVIQKWLDVSTPQLNEPWRSMLDRAVHGVDAIDLADQLLNGYSVMVVVVTKLSEAPKAYWFVTRDRALDFVLSRDAAELLKVPSGTCWIHPDGSTYTTYMD